MAEKSNIVKVYGDDSPFGSIFLTVGSSTVLAPMDLVKRSSGAAVAQTAGNIADFVGPSNDLSRNGDTENMQIYLRCICTCQVTSATYIIGQSLVSSAGANGTAWNLADATSGENGIAWSREYKSSSVTTLEVLFDAYLTGNAVADKGLFNTSSDT